MSRTEVPHGTISGYKHYGCKCPECRAANNAYAKERRNAALKPEPAPSKERPRRLDLPEIDDPLHVPVECWCGRKTVQSTLAEIRAGRTSSCGLPRCRDRRKEIT